MATRPLRVSIFPYIPDLAKDGLESLKQFIARTFKKQTGIEVEVRSDADPYDLNLLKSSYLSSSPTESYDVMELDTIILGELVKSGKVKKIDKVFDAAHLQRLTDPLFSWCLHSAKVKGDLYGVPTLQCASFLVELVSVGHDPKVPLLKDWPSFSELKTTLNRQEKSGHHILIAGDFRGSWGLPMFYLEAYVDEHGKDSIHEGVDAPVNDPQIIQNLKDFTDLGEVDGKNPDTDGTFHEKPELLVHEVIDSQHILMYAYSESVGEPLHAAADKKLAKKVLKIVSPPLESHNFLLTYTDALVVSNFSDQLENAKKFIEFYTSLDIRAAIAFGRDLPPSVKFPRYVLPARTDFFTETGAINDQCYREFHAALKKHSIPAPNHDVYERKDELQKSLEKMLGMKQKAQAQLIKPWEACFVDHECN